ncbi:hypothetical protein D3C71_1399700 [compost metagenome]
MVDRIAPQGDAVHGEHGELGAFVVVAGVVAVRTFQRVLPAARMMGIGLDVAFEHDLGGGGHREGHAQSGRDLGACAAQQAGELVLTQAVGHGRDGAQQRGRVGP